MAGRLFCVSSPFFYYYLQPSQNNTNRYYEADLAQPLDLDKIPNYEKVSKFFRDQPWTKWDGSQMGFGEVYAIPYVFATGGLVVNTSKYTKNLDDIGWEVLFDTDLKGRVSSKNSIPSLLLILDLLGIPREDLITDTEGTLEKTRDTAIALKNNVLKFWDTGSEIVDLMKNEEVWVAHIEDGNGRKLSQFDAKFKYVLPKEGGLVFVDTFVIPKIAVNPAGANLFIDFMLRPDIGAMLTEQSGYTTVVESALDMTKGIDKDLYRFTDVQLKELKWLPNLSQDVRSAYVEFWEEIISVQ